jgi:hypothetical protein
MLFDAKVEIRLANAEGLLFAESDAVLCNIQSAEPPPKQLDLAEIIQ